MQVNDLVVTGDARILGNLYTKDGNVSGGSGGSGSGDSGITYKLSKSGSTITLTGSDGSTSSVTDANTDTNTTYSNATTSAAGLMSASDKSKLDGITASADSVSFSRSLSSGTKIGTITINGTGTDLYCQTNTDTNTTYSAGTGLSLSGTAFSVKYGTAAGTACQGNDSRLSNARTPTAHNQAASTITAGTLAGQVVANASAVTTLGTAQVRNIYAGTSDMTAGSTSLTTGAIYLVYE